MLMNAFQCYLKRTINIIPLELKAAKQMGYNAGIKMVRGAYMVQEKKWAKDHGTPYPIWDDI